MKTLKERISEISFHLQSLSAPEFFSEVQDAAERKDRNTLLKVCRKAKIPEIYHSTVASVIFSVGPEQKWPPVF